MRRTLLGTFFVLLAIAAVVGGRYLERSGTAEQGLDQAMEQLPGSPPLERLPELVDPAETPSSEADEDDAVPPATPSPGPSGPDVVQADGVVAPPVGDAFYWGVHQADVAYEPSGLDELGAALGADPAIVMWYQEWEGSPPFPAEAAARLIERGAVPMVTWEAWAPPAQDPSLEPDDVREDAQQPEYSLSRIIAGEHDDYIRSYAEDIADFGGPVMLRPFHEMNGFWYPWGGTVNGNEPADVVAAWDHLHTIFEQAGADNVTWVWSVNHLSLPDQTGNTIDVYWPGEEQVDWIGVSGFNFGDTSSVSSWLSFDAVYGDVLAQLEDYDRPIVLAELATVKSGGDEGAWIADTFSHLRQDHPQVGALVWFDREVEGVRDFRIRSTEASERAFVEAVEDVGVIGAPAALRTATSAP